MSVHLPPDGTASLSLLQATQCDGWHADSRGNAANKLCRTAKRRQVYGGNSQHAPQSAQSAQRCHAECTRLVATMPIQPTSLPRGVTCSFSPNSQLVQTWDPSPTSHTSFGEIQRTAVHAPRRSNVTVKRPESMHAQALPASLLVYLMQPTTHCPPALAEPVLDNPPSMSPLVGSAEKRFKHCGALQSIGWGIMLQLTSF